MKIAITLLAALVLSPAVASAQEKAAAKAPAMDMSKMGPWTRKPTDEAKTKAEVAAFFAAEEEITKKGDMNAMLARMDFPVFMVTDDAQGKAEAAPFAKDAYVAMMKPFMENMPKDMKMTHKPTVVVLSDSIVAFTDDFSMTMGKNTMKGRNAGLLIKVGGQWKWKSMVEAGWGGMSAPPAAK